MKFIENNRLFIKIKHGGVSLGHFIFWSELDPDEFISNKDVRLHEYGHSYQSRILGPIYLFAVGIPSISRVFYAKLYYCINKKKWENYFNGYPENWADNLGFASTRKQGDGEHALSSRTPPSTTSL